MSLRIGVLGGGQLGRMMALAGYPLNLSFSFLIALVTALGSIGPTLWRQPGQPRAPEAFIDSADVFTYEFENIPTAWVNTIAAQKPVFQA